MADNLNIPNNQKNPKHQQRVGGKNRGHANIPDDRPPELSGKDINEMLAQFKDFMSQDNQQPRVPVMHPQEEPNVSVIRPNKKYVWFRLHPE